MTLQSHERVLISVESVHDERSCDLFVDFFLKNLSHHLSKARVVFDIILRNDNVFGLLRQEFRSMTSEFFVTFFD